MAVANYHDAYGTLPPPYVADEKGRPLHSWRVLLLPFIDQRTLYEQYDFSQPWNSEANLKLAGKMPSVYAFHGEYEPGTVTANYLAVVGDETVWTETSHRTIDDVADDHATTILFVENAGEDIHWMEPRDLSLESMSLQVNDPKGISSKYLTPSVTMLDGSLLRLEENLPQDVLRAMLTANGGEELSETGDTWKLLSDGRLRQERDSATSQ